jgi:hypothetical protein
MRTNSIVVFGVLTFTALGTGMPSALGQDATNDQGFSRVAIADTPVPNRGSSSSETTGVASSIVNATPAASTIRPFSSVGIGAKFSLLGIGVEAATPLSWHTNLRGGVNLLSYSTTFSTDGINYAATLQLRSVDALLDWYPFRGSFHVSPGAMIYNGNQLKANTSVPAGEQFSLNSTSYMSSSVDPVGGNASLKFSPAAPMVLAGWGNVVPRTKHISIPVEVGTVFSGTPHALLNLNGTVCNPDGTNCRTISSDSTVQENIAAQQAKFTKDVNAFVAYPVISVGFAYKFSLGSQTAAH